MIFDARSSSLVPTFLTRGRGAGASNDQPQGTAAPADYDVDHRAKLCEIRGLLHGRVTATDHSQGFVPEYWCRSVANSTCRDSLRSSLRPSAKEGLSKSVEGHVGKRQCRHPCLVPEPPVSLVRACEIHALGNSAGSNYHCVRCHLLLVRPQLEWPG